MRPLPPSLWMLCSHSVYLGSSQILSTCGFSKIQQIFKMVWEQWTRVLFNVNRTEYSTLWHHQMEIKLGICISFSYQGLEKNFLKIWSVKLVYLRNSKSVLIFKITFKWFQKLNFSKEKKVVIRGRSISNANARFLSYDGVRGREMNQDLISQGGHNENKIIVI